MLLPGAGAGPAVAAGQARAVLQLLSTPALLALYARTPALRLMRLRA